MSRWFLLISKIPIFLIGIPHCPPPPLPTHTVLDLQLCLVGAVVVYVVYAFLGGTRFPTFICFHFTDINELNLPKTCNTEFPDPDDLLTFKLIICPDEGFYKDGRFVFNFKVCVLLKSC